MTLDDVTAIMEVLASYSYKWMEIGIALDMPLGELQTLSANPDYAPGAPHTYLTAVITSWIENKQKEATKGNLVEAVAGSIVALGAIAKDLDKKLTI